MKAKTKKWLGIGLAASPIPVLVLTLALYAISNLVFSSVAGGGNGGSELAVLIGNIVNVALGLIGFLATIGIIIGIPVGIILIVNSDRDPKTNKELVKEMKMNPHYNGDMKAAVERSEQSLKDNPHYNS
ncbi:hypothetical protein HON52_04905 [Candidatus Uhrbacteria bacterium]|jgi:hypothetical protein|nr:hypothetical protein [Candidatus Uhrbacteria bacterium]